MTSHIAERVRLASTRGRVKRVHINQHIIKSNKKTGRSQPAITVQTSKGSLRAQDLEASGPWSLQYSPDKPLSCGATVWIETTAALKLTGVEE